MKTYEAYEPIEILKVDCGKGSGVKAHTYESKHGRAINVSDAIGRQRERFMIILKFIKFNHK